MEARDTALSPEEYVSSVALTDEAVEVYATDGAALYRVGDDHFVILTCSEHEDHEGHRMLQRVLPRTWECFYQAINVEDGFEAFHYGPEA